jgi:hypothetical protein
MVSGIGRNKKSITLAGLFAPHWARREKRLRFFPGLRGVGDRSLRSNQEILFIFAISTYCSIPGGLLGSTPGANGRFFTKEMEEDAKK